MRNSRILTLVTMLVAMILWQELALADYALDFHVPDQGAIGEVNVFGAFHTTISNTGSSDDTITITMVKNVPAIWEYGVTMCVDNLCYSPSYLVHTMPLAAGALTNLDVDVTPLSIGEGSVTITVTSDGDPSLNLTSVFTVVTPGLDVLLVAGDDAMGNDTWYHQALTNAGKTVGTWKLQEMGTPGNLELSEFDVVVWESGTVDGGLNMDDFAALAYYIQHGGNLFLSGQNLAFESCNPASAHYSVASRGWFNTILKTDHAGTESTVDFASGLVGDIVTSGLLFNLHSGDGANNNSSMDALTTLSGGIETLRYGSANVAATRSYYGSGKSFFCGFAFEGIDTDSNRSQLINQVLLWFDGQLTPAGDVVSPLMASVPYASPNPFNPQTNIQFEVGGTQTVSAEVTIYDVKGQVVRDLFLGTVSPGPRSMLWNGRGNDGRNLSTGIYMARVRLDNQSKTVKMTLVK